MSTRTSESLATPITLLMNWNSAAKEWRAAGQVLTGRLIGMWESPKASFR